ncbi:MAG: glycosyltransferase [Proteobacteria bacterium]|nr:glycosyltransferase [Pseudomonadota bacterium]
MPKVSVITATYNRANILGYTISSLLGQTFLDWELLVVGDACTDNTKEVVESFHDPRIRFFNLKENVGDQCGPNNEGVLHARGQYIAFLSHDDLWMPNHLQLCLEALERSGADFVHPLGLAIWPQGKNRLLCADFNGDPNKPFSWLPASFWFFKKQLTCEIGQWKHYSQCLLAPSQDWLFRVRAAGKKIVRVHQITVVAIVASGRTNVYENREHIENKQYFVRMGREPDFIENELVKVAIHHACIEKDMPVIMHLRKGIFNAILKISWWLKFEPFKVRFALTYGKKGGFIRSFHKKIGYKK